MKMLLLILGIMATTALVLIFFTREDIGAKMLEAEEKSVRNAIYLVKLNLVNQYKSLLFHKLTTVAERKDEMKHAAYIVSSGINRFHQMQQSGLISEADARKLALDWVREQKYGKDAHFFIYDRSGAILSHPNRRLEGQDMSGLRDAKGMGLFRSMMDRSQKEGVCFSTFLWDDMQAGGGEKKLGCFIYNPGWKWVVATAMNIEDIEADARKKLGQIIQELQETFGKVKIAQNGYLFLFNGKREVLIPPRVSKDALQAARNSSTGDLLLDDLMSAAKTPENPVEYMWSDVSANDGQGLHEAYVDYFKLLDWYIVAGAQKDEIQAPARLVVARQAIFISMIFLAGALLASLLVGRISRHLKKLADYAKQLPSQDLTSPARPVSDISQLPAKYKDEVGGLAESFIFMEESLRKYVKDLQDATAAKERIESELKIAREIQMSIVPKLFPPFPNRTEFDIFATLRPAKEVGGDFYDFFFIDDDRLFFALGDVSGKGVPASLFMAVTKTLIRSTVRKDSNPDEVLSSVNDMLCEGNDACMFVTVSCGVLNVRTGEVVCADAGHNPNIYLTSAGEACYLDAAQTMALGIMEGVPYRTHRSVLKPGDVLFMYTDGVTEAVNAKDELFSEERLLQYICELKNSEVQDMIFRVMEEIDQYAQSVPQADDITMMAMKYKGV
jgi:sigma-B regulation protein RsbU (phosphoserine phosphatase)